MTYAELFIPYAREIRQPLMPAHYLTMVKAHNKEIHRRQARAWNWCWVADENGVASKIDGGVLSTNIRDGVVAHEFHPHNEVKS